MKLTEEDPLIAALTEGYERIVIYPSRTLAGITDPVQLEEEKKALEKEILALLSSCTTKDLRSYYLPLEECYRDYEEGKYEIANKYITVILECFRLDIDLIRFDTGIMDIPDSGISFSYFTEEEFSIVERLIEKDRQKSVLSEVNKKALLSMKEIKL